MSPNQIFVRNLVGVVTTIAATTTIAMWWGAASRHPARPAAPVAPAASIDMPATPELGARLFEAKGCIACHTIDGSPRVGPSFQGSWGSDVVLGDGITLRFDADYVRRSLLEPLAQSRAGYPPAMPSYRGQLTKREVDALIAFLASLR